MATKRATTARKGGTSKGAAKKVARQAAVLPREPFAKEVQRLIVEKELSQTAAAAIVQDAPSQISLLMGNHLEGFSADRLIRMLLRLGRDVDITVRRGNRPSRTGHVTVHVARDGNGRRGGGRKRA